MASTAFLAGEIPPCPRCTAFDIVFLCLTCIAFAVTLAAWCLAHQTRGEAASPGAENCEGQYTGLDSHCSSVLAAAVELMADYPIRSARGAHIHRTRPTERPEQQKTSVLTRTYSEILSARASELHEASTESEISRFRLPSGGLVAGRVTWFVRVDGVAAAA